MVPATSTSAESLSSAATPTAYTVPSLATSSWLTVSSA